MPRVSDSGRIDEVEELDTPDAQGRRNATRTGSVWLSKLRHLPIDDVRWRKVGAGPRDLPLPLDALDISSGGEISSTNASRDSADESSK